MQSAYVNVWKKRALQTFEYDKHNEHNVIVSVLCFAFINQVLKSTKSYGKLIVINSRLLYHCPFSHQSVPLPFIHLIILQTPIPLMHCQVRRNAV